MTAVTIRVAGVGAVSLEEFEARLSGYINAGAPEPVLEGTPEERQSILELVARRGDSQIKAVVNLYLRGEDKQ